MANANSPFGLKPVKHLDGSPWNGQTMSCFVASGYSGAALYVGDPVVLAGSASADGSKPTVGIATAGATNPVFGVITSFAPLATDLSKLYFASGDTPGRVVQVCVDPTVLYEVQGNSAGVIAATDVGALAALVATVDGATGGSTITGLSGWCVNYTGISTTSNLQVRIMGAVPRADNDISAVYAKWLVLINLHQLFTPASNAAAGTTILGAVGV